jgi:RNA polymerase sigma-70 factor (ECF subfamily)
MTRPVPDSAETEGLLTKIRAGETGAFEHLFARHRPFVRQVVELRMNPRLRARLDPSDVVQDVHLEAFRRFADYLERRPMPLRLWLRKTAEERLLKVERRHLRAGRRAAGREVSLPDQSSLALARQLLARGSSPSKRLERHELVQRFRHAISLLPEADRDILVMRNFEGLSNQEVAFSLGIEPDTASKRHGRALLRLRKVLLEEGFSEFQP